MRQPAARDGMAVNQLVAACQPLDTNSVYCNLLQCTHFAQTSVLAETDHALCGFVSGYLKPDEPEVLFIWQVAVAACARGCRLGTTMISHLLARPACARVRHIETSISPDNAASWALFRSIARDLDTTLASQPWLSADGHFDGNHDDEILVRIGPLAAARHGLHRIKQLRSQ